MAQATFSWPSANSPCPLLPFSSQMQSGERFAFERTSSAVNELLRNKRRSERYGACEDAASQRQTKLAPFRSPGCEEPEELHMAQATFSWPSANSPCPLLPSSYQIQSTCFEFVKDEQWSERAFVSKTRKRDDTELARTRGARRVFSEAHVPGKNRFILFSRCDGKIRGRFPQRGKCLRSRQKGGGVPPLNSPFSGQTE